MSLNKNYVNERRYIFAICTEKMVVMRPVYNRIERFKNSHHSRRGAQRDVANDVIGFQSECVYSFSKHAPSYYATYLRLPFDPLVENMSLYQS